MSRPIHAWLGFLCLAALAGLAPLAGARDAAGSGLGQLEEALASVKNTDTEARKRLAVRRVIRDAGDLLEKAGDEAGRWAVLEFMFRARQRLVALDDDAKYRAALIETCRELVKAPDEFAQLRLEADLLLSQVDQANKGGGDGARSEALRSFVARYLETPAGSKALRATMVMALEMGDTRLVNDLREIIAEHHAADLEMIAFLRDHLGGQVFGVPFVGHFKRSDGRTAVYPMDGLGHSLMVVFWSKDDPGALQYIADLAAAEKTGHERIDGRLELISVNLDELADAGESIIRKLGGDWPCLHLPSGRDNPIYDAYVRVDPLNMRVAPTGQTAMMMRESRESPDPLTPEQLEQALQAIKPSENFERQNESFRRTLIRSWSRDDYALHLAALVSGDFLIFDPEGFDPAKPPELKAATMGGMVTPIERGPDFVPEGTLRAIQACLIAPPRRYHAQVSDIRAGYQKMRELCRMAIAEHPGAPDLWLVRNRLIIAELGLWKTDFKMAHFEAAVAEARKAMDAGFPKGCDVIARFCLAREALRDPQADEGEIIDDYVADQGGAAASGPVFATASLLALDVADADRYEAFRGDILKAHTEYPMMWLYSSFLLSRYHDYWMFRVPFTAGWSYGRRLKNEMNKGFVEEAVRVLDVELPTMDGKVFRIPEDLSADYTVLYIGQAGPWRDNSREDTRPPSPSRVMRQFISFAAGREDVDLYIAMLAEADEQVIREDIRVRNSETQIDTPILRIPGGMNHPMIHRVGLLDDHAGVVMLNREGRILTTLSGAAAGNNVASVIPDTIYQLEEQAVMGLLEQGELESAKQLILKIAPAYDPEAVDEKGRKLKEPKYSLPHLRARARVYMALKQWDKALADAVVVVQRQLGAAGGMSLRTDELDESEALRDSILKRMKPEAKH